MNLATDEGKGYANWPGELKNRIHSAQQRTALAVNRELVRYLFVTIILNNILHHKMRITSVTSQK